MRGTETSIITDETKRNPFRTESTMWDGDTYRQSVVQYLKNNKVDISGKACYQFGIFTGTTFIFIYEMFRKYGLDVGRILALDSFDGLPDETPGIEKNPIWQRREFSSKYIFNNENTAQIIDQIMSKLPDQDIPVEWHEGFYSDVLTDEWVEKLKPLPAFWVDLDVDLYKSTIDVLDFMVPKKLIIPGTVISYDDWGGTEEFKGGESLAHKEMAEKYLLELECIHTQYNPPHVQKAFVVKSIGEKCAY